MKNSVLNEGSKSSANLKRHIGYKDSGFEWLGEVPEHWDVQSLRAVAALYVEKNQPDFPVLSVYREYGVILKDSRDDNHNATSLDTSNYKVVRPGDLAVNKMKAWQGSLGVSEHHGIVSPAYITCRLNQEKVTGRYIHYLLRSKTLIGALDSISYGVRVGQWDMRFEDFKKIGITIPPKPEQDGIVAFLDQKTAEIDDLIAKKQRQIELLDEQKAILINRAVTRGLNPNAKLKPSGIEWIGDIPEHWEVLPVKRKGKVIAGKALAVNAPGAQRPYLRTKNVYDGRIKIDDILTMPMTDEQFSQFCLRPGDVLLNEGQSLELVGRCSIYQNEYPEPCAIQNQLLRFRGYEGVSPSFATYLFRNSQKSGLFTSIATKTTSVAHLGGARFADLRLAWPPTELEQASITEFLDFESDRFRELVNKIEKIIKKLQACRSTLIAHAVTGRIKV